MNPTEQKKLAKIDSRAARYSSARSKLSRRYAAFQDKLQKLQAKHLPKIKEALDQAANVQSELETAISAAPELFQEPRTLTLHGIRLGMMDGQATVKLPRAKKEIEDLVKAIRERFTPEEIATFQLIERVTVDVPNKDAITTLFDHEATSKRVQTIAAIDYTAPGDRVFIKPADHALDKVITKLLAEGRKGAASDESEEQAAA